MYVHVGIRVCVCVWINTSICVLMHVCVCTVRTSDAILASAPPSSRVLTTSQWPFCAAINRAVSPSFTSGLEGRGGRGKKKKGEEGKGTQREAVEGRGRKRKVKEGKGRKSEREMWMKVVSECWSIRSGAVLNILHNYHLGFVSTIKCYFFIYDHYSLCEKSIVTSLVFLS